MQDYALAAYTFFANIDEMRLNPHTIAGMYRDYDSVKDTVVAMGTYYGNVYVDAPLRNYRWV